MSVDAEAPSAPGRPPEGTVLAVLAGLATTCAGLLGALLVAATGWPLPAALIPPMAVLGLFVVFGNTTLGLGIAAFGLAPLGIVQYEVAGVTLDLPEVIILGLFAKEALRFLAERRGLSPEVPRKALLLYLAGSLLGIATGLATGTDPVDVLQDFRQFTEFVVFFLLVVQHVRTERGIRLVLGPFATGCALIAAHGILQRFTGMGIPGTQLANDMVFHGGVRSGSFYGATGFGGIMVLGGGTALGLMLSTAAWVPRLFWTACLGTCAGAAVFSNTRASWLAYALLFCIVLVFVKKSPYLVSVVALGGLAGSVLLGSIVLRRLETFHVTKSERSLAERIGYYTAAWHIFRAHPVFGLGWGCYYDITSILANGRYVAVPPPSDAAVATVHSAYLQILVKSGLVGLGTFLYMLYRSFRQVLPAFRSPARDRSIYPLFVSTTATVIGYLFHAGFENFFQYAVMSQSFWMLCALTLVGARLVLDDTRDATA